ncbi:MAG: amino acid ABC transporter permease [Pelagibacterium sp. SCN 64-44]|nr:MAG: amino acid ABC transporter permease [Pelagibacterium sp. SCN 64-44]
MRDFALPDITFLLLSTQWTILLAVASFAGGSVLGLLVALMRISANPGIRWIAIVVIRVNQGMPLLLQLFIVFFGADMIGVALSPFAAAVIALSVNAGAFLGDIWRGAIQSVPRGQVEAARALGLGYVSRMRDIVIPQAVRIAVPPTVGFMVHHIKSTSLAAIIGFVELTRAGHLINATVFSPFLVFGIVAAIYFLLCWPLTLASGHLERRLAQPYQR